MTGWLEKNKDPINTTVATLFKNSKENALLSYLFQDIGVEETGGKKGKSSSNQTISSGHRVIPIFITSIIHFIEKVLIYVN